ncbi:hypothetical protein NE599_21815, partial [[Clostridium] symbiosum]
IIFPPARTCLKTALRQMCVTLCGRLFPEVGRADGGNEFSNTLHSRFYHLFRHPAKDSFVNLFPEKKKNKQ